MLDINYNEYQAISLIISFENDVREKDLQYLVQLQPVPRATQIKIHIYSAVSGLKYARAKRSEETLFLSFFPA